MDDKQSVDHRESMAASKDNLPKDFDDAENGDAAVPLTHDPKFEKRLLRKIDFRLLPILGCLYTLALVDRSNVAVARIAGMDDDLGLKEGNRASIILMVFIGYILFELPSNAFIHRLGAANWLAFLAVSFGLVTMGVGFLNNWQGLAALRVLLGVFEAGLFPGCVYLVSSWYARYEVQKRMAGFFLTAAALSAFANILAYGIIQIANHHPWKGWRWIFIIEGALTTLVGIVSWFIIVDFPDSKRNTFLTAEEKAFVKARLTLDRGGPEEHEPVTMKAVFKTAADWKPWAFSLMYMAGAVGVYAFLFFLPIILRGSLGYSMSMSFILSTPPSLFSVVEAMGISWLADKTKMRGPFVVFQGTIGIIGLCMTGFLDHPTPRYIGTFLGVAGANGLVVTTMAWQANNIIGDARRAVSTAILISCSGIGGIYSSMVFRQQDAPNYIPGLMAVMAINIAAVLTALVTMFLLRRSNRKADQGGFLCEGREGFRYTL